MTHWLTYGPLTHFVFYPPKFVRESKVGIKKKKVVLIHFIWGSQIAFSRYKIPLLWSSGIGFESEIRARFGIESMRGRWDAKKTIGITGLVDILGWDYGMEDPIEDPHFNIHCIKRLLYLGFGFMWEERFLLYVQWYLKMWLSLRLVSFTEKTRNPRAIVFSCQITYQLTI